MKICKWCMEWVRFWRRKPTLHVSFILHSVTRTADWWYLIHNMPVKKHGIWSHGEDHRGEAQLLHRSRPANSRRVTSDIEAQASNQMERNIFHCRAKE